MVGRRKCVDVPSISTTNMISTVDQQSCPTRAFSDGEFGNNLGSCSQRLLEHKAC